mmetsp:Transcript_11036/g.36271  ORF Transcript_11036/g.36271 Transcript_11036/m.36271 type:complete len:261 (-) Transcript_11036:60-842(-)
MLWRHRSADGGVAVELQVRKRDHSQRPKPRLSAVPAAVLPGRCRRPQRHQAGRADISVDALAALGCDRPAPFRGAAQLGRAHALLLPQQALNARQSGGQGNIPDLLRGARQQDGRRPLHGAWRARFDAGHARRVGEPDVTVGGAAARDRRRLVLLRAAHRRAPRADEGSRARGAQRGGAIRMPQRRGEHGEGVHRILRAKGAPQQKLSLARGGEGYGMPRGEGAASNFLVHVGRRARARYAQRRIQLPPLQAPHVNGRTI